ncbi:MAG: folylpolyglutamate synthase/dihydrofolate synthase family protein [Bacillota bacterium]
MTYDEALKYFHSMHRFGSSLGLSRIKVLLEALGDPHNELSVIHVAGTNGKGSTTAMIASMLKQAGIRTGMYISPFLERFTERISVNGMEIPGEAVADLAPVIKDACKFTERACGEHPTEFEAVTAMAFLYFKQQQVECVALEVGLGGRFDATNVVDRPRVSVITRIGMDHMERLGPTLRHIATEKAGIIKPGCPVVSSPQADEAMEVVCATATSVGSVLRVVGRDMRVVPLSSDLSGQTCSLYSDRLSISNLHVPLIGEHQSINAATAVEAVSSSGFSVTPDDIRSGIAATRWPGRMEVISRDPLVILDGAHNPDGANAVVAALARLLPGKRCILVSGVLADKAVSEMASVFARCTRYAVLTRPDSPRALDPHEYGRYMDTANIRWEVSDSIAHAVDRALSLAGPDDFILITGSLYLVGAARTYTRRLFPEYFEQTTKRE